MGGSDQNRTYGIEKTLDQLTKKGNLLLLRVTLRPAPSGQALTRQHLRLRVRVYPEGSS